MSASRIVIVGFGPVASRLAEELMPEVRAGQVALTIIGAEQRPAYNRIRIGDVSVGRIAPEELVIDSPEALAADGVDLRRGIQATRIDRSAKIVALSDGERLPYDKLVLAAGAEPRVPRCTVEARRGGKLDAERAGAEMPQGVVPLRTMEDALAVREKVQAQQPVVVLGGGVLGVEAALALAEMGREVKLLHRGNIPMSREVDLDAGMLLRRELLRVGVDVRAASDVREVVSDDGKLTAVRTSLDERIPAALLVVCIGVAARDELAKDAGLPCSWGVTVGYDARSTGDPDIFAVGDCSSVDGKGSSGLIAPGWLQAEAAAASLRQDLGLAPQVDLDAAGEPIEFARPQQPAGLDVILMKSKTLNMACAGKTDVDPWDPSSPEVSTWSDPRRGQYLRIVVEGEKLIGFVSIGMPRTAAELSMHASRGTLPAADRTALLAAEHATKEAELGPEDVLCRCAGTTVGMVQEAALCCQSIDDVASQTRAGTGCGTCHRTIEKILDESEKQPA
ncbi:FAD-dependent oxidoreductase [Nesterenkonia populi]|uniref:FAD-dependent oxidoreductase n=1 Tax=Nesterenkonia populi TaxID=1591087 RepID=UPI0011BE0CD3|nr:FAD-dependent oxidoreductase [Nesterenkonia populi]